MICWKSLVKLVQPRKAWKPLGIVWTELSKDYLLHIFLLTDMQPMELQMG